MNLHNCTVDIFLQFPGQTPLTRRIEVDLRSSGFDKLPRDREIFESAQTIARQQENQRDRAVNNILENLLNSLRPELTALVKSRDTINGYEPTEIL